MIVESIVDGVFNIVEVMTKVMRRMGYEGLMRWEIDLGWRG